MIQAVNFFNTQQLKGLNNLQCAGQFNKTFLAQSAAHKGKTSNLQSMASAIRKTRNNASNQNITNFKGNSRELINYLEAQVKSGDLDIKGKNCNKTIKTADGKTYQVTIGTKKTNDDIKIITEGFGEDAPKTAYIQLKELTKGKRNKKGSEITHNFNYDTKEFNNNEKLKKEYAEMKQRYGTI